MCVFQKILYWFWPVEEDDRSGEGDDGEGGDVGEGEEDGEVDDDDEGADTQPDHGQHVQHQPRHEVVSEQCVGKK